MCIVCLSPFLSLLLSVSQSRLLCHSLSLLSEQRLIFIVPAVIKGGNNSDLYLYVFDLLLLCYFCWKPRYCPNCMYNELHVLRTGKKLKNIFVTRTSRRFSGTKKLIVGISAIATLGRLAVMRERASW